MNFIDFQVRAAIVGNYKHDRLFGRGSEYGEAIIASAIAEVKAAKELLIGHYESKSGDVVRFRLDGQALTLVEETNP